ncbi:hypothetical protein HDU85_006878 [Gaertneriomyces sp. JEL0708]|nr:hypothetical protein HDU85_006878 [Gaertneriomyces sp. JEL0708]
MKVQRTRLNGGPVRKRRKTDQSNNQSNNQSNDQPVEQSDESDSEFNPESDSDNDDETGTSRLNRIHYSKEMNASIIAALREWLELNHIDTEEAESVEIPESVKHNQFYVEIAPLMAAAQYAEIAQRNQLAAEAQAVREAMAAKKEQARQSYDIEQRKNFVLAGGNLPTKQAAPIVVPERTREVPDYSLKARLMFIMTRVEGIKYDQLASYLDRIRTRLQIRSIRNMYGVEVDCKHVSALIEREPMLGALFNLLLIAVLMPDHRYDAEFAHQSINHYSDEEVTKMVRAMQDDSIVSRKRLNGRGTKRSYQISGRYQDAIRVIGTVPEVHDNVRQMYDTLDEMTTSVFGSSWPMSVDTPASTAWAYIEGLHRGIVDIDASEVAPPSLILGESRRRALGARDDPLDDQPIDAPPSPTNEANNERKGPNWILPVLDPNGSFHTLNWQSLIDVEMLSEEPGRPHTNEGNQLNGLPHHVFGQRFGLSTEFGDQVLQMSEQFDQDDDASISQSSDESVAEPHVDPVSELHELIGQRIDKRLQSKEVVSMADSIVKMVHRAGRIGITIDSLLQSLTSRQSVPTSSINSSSIIATPRLHEDSSVFDYALATVLFTNRAFVAPGFTTFMYVHQEFSQYWQIPDFRSVDELRDEERSWHMCIKQCAPQYQQVQSPNYAPNALQAHPWRQLRGDVNEDLHARMLDSVVHTVCEAATGASEQTVMSSIKTCSQTQVRALLAHLVLDGRIMERVHFDEQGNQQVMYHPSADVACYWLADKLPH